MLAGSLVCARAVSKIPGYRLSFRDVSRKRELAIGSCDHSVRKNEWCCHNHASGVTYQGDLLVHGRASP